MMTRDIFLLRVDKLRQSLSSQGLDGIFITNLTSVRYISGFTGSAGSCLITEDESYFISDGRYDIQSKKQVGNMIRFIDFGNHISIIAKNNLLKDGLNLAFEGDHTSYSQFKSISESFPKINWESTSMLMENLQAVKDESELNAIRAAVEITDVIYEEILPMLRPGTTEKEVANQLVLRYRQESDGEAYNPIVAGGENGALPHAVGRFGRGGAPPMIKYFAGNPLQMISKTVSGAGPAGCACARPAFHRRRAHAPGT